MNIAILAASFIFSLDALTPGSSPRDLPTQGRNLETGNVVVGLAAAPARVRAQCGWYEVAEGAKPECHSNEYARVAGYVFERESGIAVAQWEKRWREPQPVQYSKMRLVIALKGLGAWPQVKAWIEANDLYDEYIAAQEFASDNPYFEQGKAAIQAALGLTDEQVAAILEEAEL